MNYKDFHDRDEAYYEKLKKEQEELVSRYTATARDPRQIKKTELRRKRISHELEAFGEFETALAKFEEAGQVLSDPELGPLAKEERERLSRHLNSLVEKLYAFRLPVNPLDEKNAILEIRAGTGGVEASLFASDLLRMYVRYAERNGFEVEYLSRTAGDMRSVKEIILMIKGRDAYRRLKFEKGTHRVQRIPVTESGGRIHTSAATIAVLPEVDETETEIKEAELKIDVFRSGGPGGQSVNTTDSAVRITHLPTGLVVTCQDEKSQHKNKARALKVLRARLTEKMERERHDAEAKDRKEQVGSGDRSEKIRTYNFPQNRVTDHRIGFTTHQLEAVLDGDLHDLIDALAKDETSKILARSSETP